MLGNLDVFHVGIVVEDLDAAMRDLGRALGLTWAPVQERRQAVRTGGGEPLDDDIRFTYSSQGPPHLELIESAGRVWRPGSPGELHHVGAFADDLAAALRGYVAAGARLDFGGGHDAEPAGFAYLQVPGGLRIELVDGRRRAQFDTWLAGGAFDGR